MLGKVKEYLGILKGAAWVLSTVVIGIGMGWTYGQTVAQEAGREGAKTYMAPLTAQMELMNERDRRAEDGALWERCFLYEHPDLDDEALRMQCKNEQDWRWDIYYPWEDCRLDSFAQAGDDQEKLTKLLSRCEDEPHYDPEGGP